MEKTTKLPDLVDFGAADSNNLDARHAWEQFGGLSLEQAYVKFASHPFCRSEDFMWMGKAAFAYYFPVIDRYLRHFPDGVGSDEVDDSSAAAIALAVSTQLDAQDIRFLIPILPQLRELVSYVRSHTELLATCPDEQEYIDATWQILEAQLTRFPIQKNKANKADMATPRKPSDQF